MVQNIRAFSLLELLLVMGLVSILAATALPLSTAIYSRTLVRTKADEFGASLRQARANTIAGKENSQWGVRSTASSITLYKGTSFATRDSAFDQSFVVPSSISITQDEIVFLPVTGGVASAQSVTVSNAVETVTIEVTTVGAINEQPTP